MVKLITFLFLDDSSIAIRWATPKLIVDDQLLRIFRHLEHLESEGLENYVIPLAIRLRSEFAACRSMELTA